MNFLDKTIILKDENEDDVCMFVDKISFIKEITHEDGGKALLVGMTGGVTHSFKGETICGFLRKINMGCEWCSDKE